MTPSPLRPCVRAAFPAFTERFEGRVATMYADLRGLITTAVGNLIDPVGAALALKWRFPDGGLAPASQISTEWHQLKACATEMASHNPDIQAELCGLTLHLEPSDIDALVDEQLDANARLALKYFPKFASFPADAQLGIMSLDWAAGAAFATKFPSFTKDANAGTWQGWAQAAKDGQLNTTTPEGKKNWGVVPRNDAQIICFANAAVVVENALDPDQVYYPAFA